MESFVEKGFFMMNFIHYFHHVHMEKYYAMSILYLSYMAKNIPKISCPHHQKIFKIIISCSPTHIVHLFTLMLTHSQDNVIG
jgi:hypothetical protein